MFVTAYQESVTFRFPRTAPKAVTAHTAVPWEVTSCSYIREEAARADTETCRGQTLRRHITGHRTLTLCIFTAAASTFVFVSRSMTKNE